MPRKYQPSAGFEELQRPGSVSQIPIKHSTAMYLLVGIGDSSASFIHPAEMPMILNTTILVQFNCDQAIFQDGGGGG